MKKLNYTISYEYNDHSQDNCPCINRNPCSKVEDKQAQHNANNIIPANYDDNCDREINIKSADVMLPQPSMNVDTIINPLNDASLPTDDNIIETTQLLPPLFYTIEPFSSKIETTYMKYYIIFSIIITLLVVYLIYHQK